MQLETFALDRLRKLYPGNVVGEEDEKAIPYDPEVEELTRVSNIYVKVDTDEYAQAALTL